jgi:antitoxin CptB
MTALDKNRVIWHSRRGMLELDLLLEPFARHCFDTLTPQQQELYRQLLSCEDQDLYRWLLQCQPLPEPAFTEIIRLILAHAKNTV